MSKLNFGDQRPRLLDCKIHSHGSKLVIENHVNGGEFVLSNECRSLIENFDGKNTIREIVSLLYSKGERISFRLLFTTLQKLFDEGLLEGFKPNSNEDTAGEVESLFDLDSVSYLRPLLRITLAKHLTLKRPSPVLFYLFCFMVTFVALISPIGLLRMKGMEQFLHLHGTYAYSIPTLFVLISAMVTLKTLLKMAMVSFATGHLYRLQVKVKWFGIYLDVSDHGIFLSDKKSVIVAYQVATVMTYFFISSVGGLVYPHKAVQATFATMALLMTLVDSHPYHKSDLTKLFSTVFGESTLRHMIPFLKNRSLIPSVFGKTNLKDEKSYGTYSAVALTWVFVSMIVSMKILSQNWPLLTSGWLFATFSDFISRAVISFCLVMLFFYSLSDIALTFAKNIFRPVANPLLKLAKVVNSRSVPAHKRPELEKVLEHLMVFEDITPAARAFLMQQARVKKFSRNVNLIIQGTTGRELYVLCKGSVDVVRRETSGLRTKIATLQSPAVFGEIGVIRNIARTADVVTRGDVEVMIIDKDVFDRMLREGSMELDRKRLLDKFTLSHYISSSPLFAQLPSEAIHIFSHRGQIETCKKGTTIIKEGEVSKSFYLLLEGAVEVLKGSTKVTDLKNGDFFGEIALIADTPRTASVRAVEDCLSLRLDQDTFWEILAAHVHIAMSLETVAETRLEEIKCSA